LCFPEAHPGAKARQSTISSEDRPGRQLLGQKAAQFRAGPVRVPVTLENARAQFKDGHDVVLEAAVALMK
jgi:hypothetical protein